MRDRLRQALGERRPSDEDARCDEKTSERSFPITRDGSCGIKARRSRALRRGEYSAGAGHVRAGNVRAAGKPPSMVEGLRTPSITVDALRAPSIFPAAAPPCSKSPLPVPKPDGPALVRPAFSASAAVCSPPRKDWRMKRIEKSNSTRAFDHALVTAPLRRSAANTRQATRNEIASHVNETAACSGGGACGATRCSDSPTSTKATEDEGA